MLSDDLIGRSVYVETQLYSGTTSRVKTMLYWGIYDGLVVLGLREMVVLHNAKHYNRAGVTFSEGDKKTKKICSSKTYINLDDIISIDIEKE